MATRLNALKLKELSLVDSPANKSARVTIFKRAESAAGAPAGDPAVSEGKESPMADDDKQVAEMQAQIDDLTKKLEDATASVESLKAEKETADKVAKLSDAERAHYATLEKAEDKESFLAMSDNDRKKTVSKAAEADEVVKVGDQDIRKSVVGEAQFAVIKAQQEAIAKQSEDLRKAEEARELADLRKRADDEFAHVPGSTDERAAMLKAMNGMDEAVRKSFEAVFTAHEKLAKAAFSKVGHAGTETPVNKSAQAFETRVSEVQKRDKLSRSEAMSKAAQEFPEEFEAYQQG